MIFRPLRMRTFDCTMSLAEAGLFAGCLTVLLLAGGCSKPPVEDPRLQSLTVKVVGANATGASGKTFTGTVEARVQSNLGFRVAGKILERSVDVGQRVQKGQVLMRLDSLDLELVHTALEAKAEAARARHTQAKADEARFAGVVDSGGVSRQGYDAARAELAISKSLLEAAEAEARVSRNSSEYAVLAAAVDGVIVGTLGEPGQVVAAGQTVIQLAQDGPREASVHLPEGVRPELGSTASARLYAQSRVHQARLRQLSDAADPASRTFEARFVLEGEAALAPLGSTITVQVPDKPDSGNRLVAVPIGAVHDRGSGPGVWIVNHKSEVNFRLVQIVSLGKEEVVVSSGLEAGENVVALGAHLLQEGQAVRTKADKAVK